MLDNKPCLTENNKARSVEETHRIKTYTTLSTQLAFLSDQALLQLVENAEKAASVYSGIGGTSVPLEIEGTRIFVKKINLTDLERQPENAWSTKNIFDLPMYYQYGIGSAGFGAWRELIVNIMTTNWVLAGECPNFPMLYHWRILPRSIPEPPSLEEVQDFENFIHYWNGSSAIRSRLEAIYKAQASIVLFCEYIPYRLDTWIENKFAEGSAAAEKAVTMVESNLNAVTSFMNSHGLLHMDAHFRNIVTDGNRLYFTDFGLALCSKFELSKAESNFFNSHYNYDSYYTRVDLVTTIVGHLFPGCDPEIILREYTTGTGNQKIAPWAMPIITRYAPAALISLQFDEQLRKNKVTPYPSNELEQADRNA